MDYGESEEGLTVTTSEFIRLQLSDLPDCFQSMILPSQETLFFQTQEFLSTWGNVYLNNECKAYLWAHKKNDQITHIFPYYIKKVQNFGISIRELSLICDLNVGANYLRPMIGPFDLQILNSFLKQSSKDWDILRFDKLDAKSTSELGALKSSRRFLNTHISTSCPIIKNISLLDSFLARLAPRKNKKFTQILKKFRNQSELEFHIMNGEEALAIFPRLVEISMERFTKKKIDGPFLNERFTQFHQTLLPQLSDRIEFGVLKSLGQVQAFHYCYRQSGQLWYYQGGFNSTCEQFSPGVLLSLLMIEDSCRRYGMIDYDFLEGQEPYKYDFTDQENFLHEVVYAQKKFWVLLLKTHSFLKKYLPK